MATSNNVQESEDNAINNAAEGPMSAISSSEPHSSPIQETRRSYDCEFCFEYLEYPAATNHHCDMTNHCAFDFLDLSPSASISGSVIDCDLRSETDETSRCMSPYDERSGISPDELVMEAIAALNKHILERPTIAATELVPIPESADNTNEVAVDARPSTECHVMDQQELSVQITEATSSIAENGSDLTNGGNSDENNSMRLSDESVSQTFPAANVSRNFLCDICQRSFGVKCNLRRHMLIHTNKRPYECRVCSKAFSLKQNLDCHLRTHSGEKPYRCEVCSKAFSQKEHLNGHLRTHSGEKPYRCEVCSKAFSQKPHLDCHLRTHSGEKPYRCEVCSKSFSDKSNWTRHINNLHTVSPIITKKKSPSRH